MRALFRLALLLLALLAGARLLAPLLGLGGRRGGAHYLTGGRRIRLLFWPLAGLVAALPFLAGAARRAPDLPAWALVPTALAGVALLALSAPALWRYWRFQGIDAETVVLFSAADHHLEIRRPGATVRVVPGTVQAAHWRRHRTALGRLESLDLTLTGTATPLRLTSLPLDLAPVAAWLRARGVAVREE